MSATTHHERSIVNIAKLLLLVLALIVIVLLCAPALWALYRAVDIAFLDGAMVWGRFDVASATILALGIGVSASRKKSD